MAQNVKNIFTPEKKPHRKKRIVWFIINNTIVRLLVGWRMKKPIALLLKWFGADLDYPTKMYPSATVFAPWNLKMGYYACIGPRVNIYNKGKVEIGNYVVISQDTTICTATHDITTPGNDLVVKPIVIKDRAWIASEAFIAPGVTIGEGAVVGARAAVFKDVEPWTVVGGNPARFIKYRHIEEKPSIK